MALLVVIVSVAAFTLAVLTLSRLMFTERKVAHTHGRMLQATSLAESGVAAALRQLALPPAERVDAGGVYDNPALFQGQLVVDAATAEDRGRFAVVVPRYENNGAAGLRFGLEDESARLNLNVLLVAEARQENGGRNLLLALPGMTEQTADAILDWIDPDDEPREFGAEAEFYSSLQPPYGPRNGPLESIEELLLVRGVTPELLYGPDRNRNGLLDGGEASSVAMAADGLATPNNAGEFDRGWAGLITLHSAERNVRPDGSPKIDLNADDLEQLRNDLEAVLDEDQATFVILYRQNGPFTGNQQGGPIDVVQLDTKQPGRVKLSSVLDLIDAKLRVSVPNQQQPQVIEAAFPLARATSTPPYWKRDVTGRKSSRRVNINAAPRGVLLALPGMTEELADAIVSRRSADYESQQPERRHATWLLTEAVATLDEMKLLGSMITGQGDVFRAQVVGYFDAAGPAARLEVLLDATTTPPRLVSWKDLSRLGPGYPVEALGRWRSECGRPITNPQNQITNNKHIPKTKIKNLASTL